jgi:hypothetical protein
MSAEMWVGRQPAFVLLQMAGTRPRRQRHVAAARLGGTLPLAGRSHLRSAVRCNASGTFIIS